MEVGREKAAATDAAQSHQHLGGDIGRLEGAGGGQRLVQEDKAVCRYGIEDLAKARAFLAKASLVNGVVRAGREMGIDAVRRADAAGVGRQEHTKLQHDLTQPDRAGNDGLSAPVGTGQHIDHGVVQLAQAQKRFWAA